MKKLKDMDERELEALHVAKVIKSLVGKEMTFYEKRWKVCPHLKEDNFQRLLHPFLQA